MTGAENPFPAGAEVAFDLSAEGPDGWPVIQAHTGVVVGPSIVSGKLHVRRHGDGKDLSLSIRTLTRSAAESQTPQRPATKGPAPMTTTAAFVESYGYKTARLEEFLAMGAYPDLDNDSLRELQRRAAERSGSHVVFDPDDYDDGWLLVGPLESILAETAEMIAGQIA